MFDISYDSTGSKCRDKEAIWELLDLTDARQLNFELGRSEAEKQLLTTLGTSKNKLVYDLFLIFLIVVLVYYLV